MFLVRTILLKSQTPSVPRRNTDLWRRLRYDVVIHTQLVSPQFFGLKHNHHPTNVAAYTSSIGLPNQLDAKKKKLLPLNIHENQQSDVLTGHFNSIAIDSKTSA